MGIRKTMTGTSWHIEKFTREEGDPRRHRSRCIHYDKRTKECHFRSGKCIGSAHCMYYKEPITINMESNVKSDCQTADVKPSNTDEQKKEARLRKKGTKIVHKKFGNGTVKGAEGVYSLIKFDDGREIKLSISDLVNHNLIKFR